MLFAFDLIEHDGDDLRDLPLIERKRRLAKLLGRAKRRAIQFVEHLTGDGPTVFEHVCRMGLEGIVSKRVDAPYRGASCRVKTAIKSTTTLACIHIRVPASCSYLVSEYGKSSREAVGSSRGLRGQDRSEPNGGRFIR